MHSTMELRTGSLLTSLLPLLVMCQERPTAEKAVLDLVYQHCPQADIITMDRTPQGYVEIDYLCNGRMVEIGIMNGLEEFREEEIDAADAPMEKINARIAKDHPGGFLDEVSLMIVKDTTFIKAEVIHGGIEYHLFFTAEGKTFKPAREIGNEKWSLEAIRAAGATGPAGYDMLSPHAIIELPPILREISGIALLDERTIICVQDELGVVFHLELPGGHIKRIQRFTDIGDFEDIAIVDGNITVLRSDGMIHTLQPDGSVKERLLQLTTLNVEGLHSAPDGTLYVASKEPPITGEQRSNVIYTVVDGRAEIAIPLDEAGMDAKFQATYGSMKAGRLAFAPSALATHPITGDLYILSATDRALAIYSANTLKAVFPLPAEIYYKPEGIAFHSNGDLLISTEGDKKGFSLPAIIKIKYEK